MLVVAKITGQLHPVMGRVVRIIRLGVLCFLCNPGRAAVAGQATAFGDRRRLFPLAVAPGAWNVPEGVQVAARHFPPQGAGESFFGKVANHATGVRHFPDVNVLFRKNFLRAMASRAVPGLCVGNPDFGGSGFLRPRPLGKTPLAIQQKKENHQSGKPF